MVDGVKKKLERKTESVYVDDWGDYIIEALCMDKHCICLIAFIVIRWVKPAHEPELSLSLCIRLYINPDVRVAAQEMQSQLFTKRGRMATQIMFFTASLQISFVNTTTFFMTCRVEGGIA